MKRYLYLLLTIFILISGCEDDPTTTGNSMPEENEQTDGTGDNGDNSDDNGDDSSDDNDDGSSESPCGDYPCNNIDLVGWVSPDDLMGEPLSQNDPLILNDIWGWTDPAIGKEYALVGLNDGVTFVDLSTPSEPVVIGKLPEELNNGSGSAFNSATSGGGFDMRHEKSSWRDFKVYQNHLYVVSDAQPHGLQIFDLTRLRNVNNPPVEFTEDAHYDGFGKAHNIAINEETGFSYIVGSDTYGGGLHILDLQSPLNPQFVGFHSDSTVGHESTGYVHDAQCVVYEGPDTDYQGDEICMNSSETHLVVANVTDKENTTTISKATYDGNDYAHQGWLTEDQRYFLLDDELDEYHGGKNTTTYIWDMQDLDDPQLIGTHTSNLGSIDHNLYIKGDYVYQANYTAGLRILSLDNIASGKLSEIAYFDTFPDDDEVKFDGAWSNYPYFESGIVIVGDISNGLFILEPKL